MSPEAEIHKLWAEHRSLSYICYCDDSTICLYCKRQKKLLEKIEALQKKIEL